MKGGWLPDRGHERDRAGDFIRTRDMRAWARVISALKPQQLEWLGREILNHCDLIDRLFRDIDHHQAERRRLENLVADLHDRLDKHLAPAGSSLAAPSGGGTTAAGG